MKKIVIVTAILASMTVMAQQPPINSPLLDHLAGKWVMQGTVGKQPQIHDLDAEWVLQHHYLRFREASRDKNAQGEPKYDSMVFIAWNDKPRQYSCVWLDVYGGQPRNRLASPHPKTMNSHLYSRMSTARPLSPTLSSTTPRRTHGRTVSITLQKEWPSHSRASS